MNIYWATCFFIINFIVGYLIFRLFLAKSDQVNELEEELVKELANLQEINFGLMNDFVGNIIANIKTGVINGEIEPKVGIYLLEFIMPLATFYAKEMHISYMLYEHKDDSKEYKNLARKVLEDAAKKFEEKEVMNKN